MSQTKAELINAKGNAAFDTDTLYVDATNNRVGIGTTAPGCALDVVSQTVPQFRVRYTSGGNYVSLLHNDSDGYLDTTAGGLVFRTNTSTERARIDSSGRLLVGTSTSANENATFQVQGSGAYAAQFFYSAANAAGSYLALSKSRGSAGSPSGISSGDVQGAIVFKGYAGSSWSDGAYIEAITDGTPGTGDIPTRLVFSTTADGASSPTEAMRLDKNQRGYFAKDLNVYQDKISIGIKQSSPAHYGITTTAGDPFYVGTGSWFYGQYLSGTSSAWNSISDEREKTDLVDIENGLQKVSTLRSVVGRYTKAEPENRQPFLLAQDVQAVLPEAVDASNPDCLGLRYTDLIPLLVAALKESKERIEVLEASNADLLARVSALEAS